MFLTTEQWQQAQSMKAQIKDQAELQRQEKAILRTPHSKIIIPPDPRWPNMPRGAWYLQGRTQARAKFITELLIAYNKLRGKDFSMHLGKQQAAANG
jgi:hypothetical protein